MTELTLTVEEQQLKDSIQTALVACDKRDYELLLDAAGQIATCIADQRISALGISPEELASLKAHLDEFGDADLSALTARIQTNETGLAAALLEITAVDGKIAATDQKIIDSAAAAEAGRDALRELITAVDVKLASERDRLTTYMQNNDTRLALTEAAVNLLEESKSAVELRLTALEECCSANSTAISNLVTDLASLNDKVDANDVRLTGEITRVDGRIDDLESADHADTLNLLQVIESINTQACIQRSSAVTMAIDMAKLKWCSPSGDTTSTDPTPSTSGAAGSI